MIFLKQNWREILGWIVIVLFAYFYLFRINNLAYLQGREKAFDFLITITILVLAWLRLNKN